MAAAVAGLYVVVAAFDPLEKGETRTMLLNCGVDKAKKLYGGVPDYVKVLIDEVEEEQKASSG